MNLFKRIAFLSIVGVLVAAAFSGPSLAQANRPAEFVFTDFPEGRPVLADTVAFTVTDLDGIKAVQLRITESQCGPRLGFLEDRVNGNGATQVQVTKVFHWHPLLLNPNSSFRLCLRVIDTKDNVTEFVTAQTILLQESFITITSEDFVLNKSTRSHTHSFIYPPNDTEHSIPSLSGTASTGGIIKLYSGNTVLKSQHIGEDGLWSFENIQITLREDRTVTSRDFDLRLYYQDGDRVREVSGLPPVRIYVVGRTVKIEIDDPLARPLPIKNRGGEKVVEDRVRWRVSKRDIDLLKHRLILLETPESCSQGNYNEEDARVLLANILTTIGEFTFTEDHVGHYACIEAVVEGGHRFFYDMGLVERPEKPTITITDGFERAFSPHVDEFTWRVENRSPYKVKMAFLDASTAFLNRSTEEERKLICQEFVDFFVIQDTAINRNGSDTHTLTFANPFYNKSYLCLKVTNTLGVDSFHVSQNPLNLADAPAKHPTVQGQSFVGTPTPARLEIPEKVRNSVTVTSGCRQTLIARDLLVSAGHCDVLPLPLNKLGRFIPGYTIRLQNPFHDDDEVTAWQRAKNDFLRDVVNDPEGSGFRHRDEASRYFDEQNPDPLPSFDTEIYRSPYYGIGLLTAMTAVDFQILRLVDGSMEHEDLEYAPVLVYTHPTSLHQVDGEFRGFPPRKQRNLGIFTWKAGSVYAYAPQLHNTFAIRLEGGDTFGTESGSSLWSEDTSLDATGIVGTLSGGSHYSSVWLHGDTLRKELVKSRKSQLDDRRRDYDGSAFFTYQEFLTAVVNGDHATVTRAIDSGWDPNRNKNGKKRGAVLARAIDLAQKFKKKLDRNYTDGKRIKYENALKTLKALALGGANPSLKTSFKRAGTPLHLAVRTNNPEIFKTIWLNWTHYDYETKSRTVKSKTDPYGNTALHEAIVQKAHLSIIKYLFTDAGEDIFVENDQGETPMEMLLMTGSFTDWHTDVFDWIGKAYLYRHPFTSFNNEGRVITNEDLISNMIDPEWKRLVCEKHDWGGGKFRIDEIALQTVGPLRAALQRIGNINGVGARYICPAE